MSDRILQELNESICHLARELHDATSQKKIEYEWIKSHSRFVTKQDLEETERRILMQIQQAIDALNELSTAADAFSLRADRVENDINALIAAFQASDDLTPEQEAAVAKAKTSIAGLVAAGDKTDAAVAKADAVLPTPAPAAPPLPPQ